MGVTTDFAHFVQDTTFSDLPAVSVSRAKDLFLDTIGVALVGSVQSTGQAVVAYARESGGNPEATVWSGGLATSASMAAFTNGILAHNMDFDDWLPTGEESEDWPRNGGHASGILVPVAVALGEKLGASGKSMIEAYVLGVEVYTKIAANCPNLRGRGFHGMPVYGSLGATATAAKLLGLNAHQIEMAFGIVASGAGGLFANVRGYSANAAHSGNAARLGIEAAILASAGFTGKEAIIESPMGFCDSFLGPGTANFANMTAALGNPFYMEAPGPGIKPYPCAWPTFYAIDGVLGLVQEHSLAYENIEEVVISVSPYHYNGTESMYVPEPASVYESRFSTNFTCGTVILNGNLGVDDFSEAKLTDPLVREAVAKIHLVVDETRADEEGVFFAPVTIKTRDGRELDNRVDVCRGHPRNPLSYSEIVGKYRDNALRVLPEDRVGASIQLIDELDQLDDARELAHAVTAPNQV